MKSEPGMGSPRSPLCSEGGGPAVLMKPEGPGRAGHSRSQVSKASHLSKAKTKPGNAPALSCSPRPGLHLVPLPQTARKPSGTCRRLHRGSHCHKSSLCQKPSRAGQGRAGVPPVLQLREPGCAHRLQGQGQVFTGGWERGSMTRQVRRASQNTDQGGNCVQNPAMSRVLLWSEVSRSGQWPLRARTEPSLAEGDYTTLSSPPHLAPFPRVSLPQRNPAQYC